MTTPEDSAWIDAEIVEKLAPDADKPTLHGALGGIEEGGSMFVIGSYPTDASQIQAEFIPTQTHGSSQADKLSQVLYDIAKIAERLNMEITDEDGLARCDEYVGVRREMEQIIVMIATAPLTQHYAMRLAFEKP